MAFNMERDREQSSGETKSNQERYDELFGLLEGNPAVEIKTADNTIHIEPEDKCQLDGGCLDIDIRRENTTCFYDVLDYHVNRNLGIVSWTVDLVIDTGMLGFPGGGNIEVTGKHDHNDYYDDNIDYGKFAEFIREQALVGEKLFPEPALKYNSVDKS